jgi:hypothetical protein
MFEKLDRAVVLFDGDVRVERSGIPPPAGFRIPLARIEPEFTGFKFFDHKSSQKSEHERLNP